MTDIKSGDTVKLKSGGPIMTVEEIDNYDGKPSARCIWFDGSEAKEKLFDLVVLTPYISQNVQRVNVRRG